MWHGEARCAQPAVNPAELALAEKDVIILGGGLAGISAAVRFVQLGVKPTLIEQRPFLGGRAFSFLDRASNEEIDNGQHVILGVCNEFLQLLTDLGTRDEIDIGASIDVPVSFNNEIANLRASTILGNGAALFRFSHLGIKDRISVARLLLKVKFNLIKIDANKNGNGVSFAEWLAGQNQSQESIDLFWTLFILPVFNCHANEVAAEDAIEFVRTALLGNARDAAIGYPRVGLSSLIGKPAQEFLSTNGVEMILSNRVATISKSTSGDFVVETSDGVSMRSRNVICALAPKALARILPSSDEQFSAIRTAMMSFEHSPIVAVHLWYERPVMTERVMAFLDRGLQWVFNDSALRSTSNGETQHIVISLSGADDWVGLDKAGILHSVGSAMREAFPLAKSTDVVNSAVVKSPDATVKLNSASRQYRIGPHTDVPGLFVAGDWTDTGLPATMEGAVRSGRSAADAVAAHS